MGYSIDSLGERKEYSVEKKTLAFNGGESAFNKFLGTNLKYPKEALRNRVSGKVLLKLSIDKSGMVTEVKILKGLSKELDTEAVRVANLTSKKWIPASEHGWPIGSEFLLPVVFSSTFLKIERPPVPNTAKIF